MNGSIRTTPAHTPYLPSPPPSPRPFAAPYLRPRDWPINGIEAWLELGHGFAEAWRACSGKTKCPEWLGEESGAGGVSKADSFQETNQRSKLTGNRTDEPSGTLATEME